MFGTSLLENRGRRFVTGVRAGSGCRRYLSLSNVGEGVGLPRGIYSMDPFLFPRVSGPPDGSPVPGPQSPVLTSGLPPTVSTGHEGCSLYTPPSSREVGLRRPPLDGVRSTTRTGPLCPLIPTVYGPTLPLPCLFTQVLLLTVGAPSVKGLLSWVTPR